ncbi:MAG TPA: hypothetical protein VL069_00790 [Opitutus sp.]|nr:hypothetical protein [Opitutus sp.]
MNRSLRTWLIPVVVTVAITVVLAWRHQITVSLQASVQREREISRKQAEQRPMKAGVVVETQIVDRAGEAIGSDDEAALAQLRKEIAELEARAAARARMKPTAAANAVDSSITEKMLPVAEWKNAGIATPTAALETALWAAAAGDVEALAGLLSIDPVVRTRVNGLLMNLPVSLRPDYGTPERLIALLAAGDVPLGAAQIHDFKASDSNGTKLTAVLRDTENKYRSANLTLRQEGEAWKIVVPATAVERYAAMLKGTSARTK